MRPGVVVRAIALGLVVCVIACCGSSSVLYAHNETDRPIDLKVTAKVGIGWSGRLAPGEHYPVWGGRESPEELIFEVDNQVLRYDKRSLPPELATLNSGVLEANWRWRPSGVKFTVEPGNRMNRWILSLVKLGMIGVIAIALIVLVLSKGLRRFLTSEGQA
jgi:hypothetical protein